MFDNSIARKKIVLTFIGPFLIVFVIGLPILYQMFVTTQIRYYASENLHGLSTFRDYTKQMSRSSLDSLMQTVKFTTYEQLTITDPQGHIVAGDSMPQFDYDISHYDGILSTRIVNGSLYTVIHVHDEDGYAHWDVVPHFKCFEVIYRGMLFFLLAGLLCIIVSLLIYRFHLLPQLNTLISGDARMKTELNIAHGVQQAMLPHDFEPTINSVLIPAREVGGDLYEYIWVGQRLYFCIGDVSDKGVPSAMAMAIIRSLFHQTAELGIPLDEIIRQVNHTMSENNTNTLFCSLFAGCVRMDTLKMEYINCGHCPPILVDNNGLPHLLEVVPNIVLGVADNFDFQKQVVQLHTDDTLLLYTDGVTEAMNSRREQFGTERLLEITAHHAAHSALIDDILSQLDGHRGEAEQNDDITMVAIQLHAIPPMHYDTISNRTIDIVDDVLKQADRTDDLRLRLAVEEVVNNIVSYAYEEDGVLDVFVHQYAFSNQHVVTMEYVDKGAPFNPLQKEQPDLTSGVGQRPIGGMGIYLARQITNLNYRYENGENHLCMTYFAK
ncbi:MAG: SpoIIE family protein phosphatase [Paludibacteraceae bacterium]|nr:SpoIIE family protein phosphatase [Paludibacteraceae bacterium]